MSSVLRYLRYRSQSRDFLACLIFGEALAFRRHIRLVRVVIQHCSRLLVENSEGTLSDTIFDKLSMMMVASSSTGEKVVFEEMKSLVQLETSRRMLSKLACFHKRIFRRAGLLRRPRQLVSTITI